MRLGMAWAGHERVGQSDSHGWAGGRGVGKWIGEWVGSYVEGGWVSE